jgi:hypothetical protein
LENEGVLAQVEPAEALLHAAVQLPQANVADSWTQGAGKALKQRTARTSGRRRPNSPAHHLIRISATEWREYLNATKTLVQRLGQAGRREQSSINSC